MTRKKSSAPNASGGLQRRDFVTLDSLRMREVFICWREGARMPNSFHTTREEAIAMARHRVGAGQTVCVLRAEIVVSIAAGLPVVTMRETAEVAS